MVQNSIENCRDEEVHNLDGSSRLNPNKSNLSACKVLGS